MTKPKDKDKPKDKPKDKDKEPSFKEWWKQYRPEDFVSRRDWRASPQDSQEMFRDFQYGDILKDDMRMYYRQGIDPEMLTEMMKYEQKKGMNQPGGGGFGVQEAFFEKFPGSREAYMAANGLHQVGNSVYNDRDVEAGKIFFDAAGNPHSGVAPSSGYQDASTQYWLDWYGQGNAQPEIGSGHFGLLPDGSFGWTAKGAYGDRGNAQAQPPPAPAPAPPPAPFFSPYTYPNQQQITFGGDWEPMSMKAPYGGFQPSSPWNWQRPEFKLQGAPYGDAKTGYTPPQITPWTSETEWSQYNGGLPLSGAGEESQRLATDALNNQLGYLQYQLGQVDPALQMALQRGQTDFARAQDSLAQSYVDRGIYNSGVKNVGMRNQQMEFDRAVQDQILAAQNTTNELNYGISNAWLQYYQAMAESALAQAQAAYANPNTPLPTGG